MATNQSFIVLTAAWRDISDLHRLEKECFGEEAWPVWDIFFALVLPGLVRLKAVVDGKIIGFVGGDPQRNKGVGWITTLGVSQNYRRMGIAETLLAECEQAMAMPRVRLCVRKSNTPAISLYKKTGFRQIDVWPRYYFSGEDALVMEKELINP